MHEFGNYVRKFISRALLNGEMKILELSSCSVLPDFPERDPFNTLFYGTLW
jgi:hypothetical protein